MNEMATEQTTAPTAQHSTRLLDRALRSTAAVSVIAGIVLVATPQSINHALDVSLTTPLRLFGFFLLGHSALLAYAVSRGPLVTLGRLNLAGIAPYPLAMIAAAALVQPAPGKILVLADGAFIAACAAANWIGLRRARQARPATR